MDAERVDGLVGDNVTTPEPDVQTSWDDLGVVPEIQQALETQGITHPFPIQTLAIPIAVMGTDLMGQARTGTGKTLAFGISILQRTILEGDEGYEDLEMPPGKPQALVMCPTRELALQVSKDLQVASTIRKARVLTVYGGVGYDAQVDALTEGVDVVVGTPGRLKDLAERGTLDLSWLRMLVLDEADEMLDLGFLPDVERLIAMAPTDRQMLMFSATMPSAIIGLARAHMHQPINVRAEGHDAQATVPDTTQFVYQAHNLDKPEIIARVLQASDVDKVMVFCKTKRAAQRLSDELEDRGFNAASIHGDLNQAMREKALKRFRAGEVKVLVATDVAARGIDVTGVSHVINHECPEDAKTYVHRIGRTGRAGHKGIAITLVDWADIVRWKTINKALELSFDDPVETYSTSAHLYTDLDIPEGTKGKLAGAQPKDRPKRDDDRRGGGRGGRDAGRGRGREKSSEDEGVEHSREPRKDRPQRSRRRLKNGEPVAEGSEQTASAPAEAPKSEEQGEHKPRRRRRNRGKGSTAPESTPEA
ncbi:putative ATP-dependent RNA helicase [Luteococcus japonicus LSP_Lj1]|uniref:RNA helicase n=1 Tax=Luteococcus japonicus LSP_Lj1 TaxID=1255658 RepID=A0A1R4JVN2_9ACTN|nr:putative ATP-dependent RNA helicase [Luteococcus japonicus LSP_Lj1]